MEEIQLRAEANILLAGTHRESALPFLPLDIAALLGGHSEVVRELVQQVGIEGFGGESDGVDALCAAATNQRVDIMAVLARHREVPRAPDGG